MRSSTTLPGPIDPSEPADLVCAATYSSRREASEHGLVVLASGLPYWLDEAAAGFGVLVEAAQVEAVRTELALYDQANANWPPRPITVAAPAGRMPWLSPLLWAVLVVWVFRWQVGHWELALAYGALDGARVFHQQEWWRPITALFLHADLLHVFANVVIGAFVFTQVVTLVGHGRAWFDVLLAAFLGNVAAAALHLAGDAISIGASTAVFAGIGLLTGRATRGGLSAARWMRWRAVLVPIGAGVVLLGLLGAGGVRVDVLAHATGFVAGLTLGFVGPQRPLRRDPG